MTSETDRIHNAEERLQTILKAVVVGAHASDPASRPGGEALDKAFTAAGALEPPYDPKALCLLLEHSSSLRQNVDAYATNIDGFGHRLEPAIDLQAEDADQRVADCMSLERIAARDHGQLEVGTPLEPTAEEVAEQKQRLQRLARIERARLDSFFDFCCFDCSFVDLRRRTRQDLEVCGNGYWEVLRDGRGDIARLVHVPAFTVRLLPLDRMPTEVEDRVRVSAVTLETVPARHRFRRYVQIQGTDRVFFKSFGDPRVISRRTGKIFESVEALIAQDPGDGPATELLHFFIHSPRSPYGVPRWIGTLLSVLGSRQMEEVNYLYFENKSVPPLALLVSGGRLSETSVPRIERFIEENLKGKERHPHCADVWREETQLRGSELLGAGLLRFDGGPRRGGRPSVHPEPGGRGEAHRSAPDVLIELAARERLTSSRLGRLTHESPPALPGSSQVADKLKSGLPF